MPYSDAMVRTPSVITQMVPRRTPKKPKLSTSSPLGVTVSAAETTAAEARPMPTMSTIITPSVHIVERTERIFVHFGGERASSSGRGAPGSARRTWGRCRR
ncbi:hypothetical protein [Streptomyces sp. KL116D]|uniref:hypothetical protein n=1 Tax=Streptomyces sp. KL116D TaxID=3045152 RepID=UPI003558EBC7